MKAEFIDVICLPVTDLERAKSFYQNVFGFTVVRDTRGGPQHSRWIELGPEGAKTTIALLENPPGQTRGSISGIVLKVQDLAQSRSHLSDYGLRPSDITAETWGSHLTINDPDGNQWILVEHEITA